MSSGNNTSSIFKGISVYNVVVLCLIGVPTAVMIRDQVDAAYLLTSLFTFFATTLTICLVFIPKVNILYFHFILISFNFFKEHFCSSSTEVTHYFLLLIIN